MAQLVARSTREYLERNGATIRPVTSQDYKEQEEATGHITDGMYSSSLIMTYKGKEFFVEPTYRDIVGLIRFIKKYGLPA